MCHAPVATAAMPLISGGKRYSIAHQPGEPAIVCLDAAPMLEPADKGRIVITGSHAALFRGKPDDVIRPQVRAIFFSDAGVGMDAAGIARLPVLDARGIAAGTASADSAEIGDSRSIYEDGVLSHFNAAASTLGARRGVRIREFVAALVEHWRVSS
jgi:hypothetical protein